jgi:hypothetical protein
MERREAMKKILVVALLAGVAGMAHAQDGSKEAAYGPALAVQTVETGFGNNQSELNAVYFHTDGGNLNLIFTGNLETNFNKLHILLDYTAGGSNTGAGLPYAGGMSNVTFDSGFNADIDIQINGGGSPTTWFINAWDFNVAQSGDYLGSNDGSGAALAGGGNWLGLGVGINNSNVLGIGGSAGSAANQADALAVTTGIEISIPLSFFGGSLPAGTRGMAFVNGGGNDFLSNQVLGGVPVGSGNLGGTVNFASIAGDQFFVIPTPGALALLGVGGLVATRRRRA